jgi:hypothetical protein
MEETEWIAVLLWLPMYSVDSMRPLYTRPLLLHL